MKELIVAVVMLGSFGNVFAEDVDPLTALNYQLTYFYLDPSEEAFAQLQQGIVDHYEALTSSGTGFEMLVGVFLGKVHEKHGWPLLDNHDLDDLALLIANRDENELSHYIWDDSQVDPGKLDVWWTSFFATGDTAYLEKLISQTGELEAQSGVENILVMGAANWSVTSNCRQHAAVLNYARSMLQRDPPVPNHKNLKEIVKQAEEPDG